MEFPSSPVLGVFLLFGDPNSVLLRSCILGECNSSSEKLYQSNRNHIVCSFYFKTVSETKCNANSDHSTKYHARFDYLIDSPNCCLYMKARIVLAITYII